MNSNQILFTPSAAEQTQNNSTGWIGNMPGQKNSVARGQTFIANEEGDLQSIELYPNMVGRHPKVIVTIHNYDEDLHKWGPALATSARELNNEDTGRWISFQLQGPHLTKGNTYGFRIESTGSYIGIGEAAISSANNFTEAGKEFMFSNENNAEKEFSFLNLAFRVAVNAA